VSTALNKIAQILHDVFQHKALKVVPHDIDNLLDDGSFETGTFVDWHVTNGEADIDYATKHISGKSARVTGQAGKETLLERTHYIPARGGKIMILQGYYKADANVTSMKARITVFDEKGGWLKNYAGDDLVVLFGSAFDWSFYKMCRVLPSETGMIQITFTVTSASGVGGKAWLDDLYVACVEPTIENIMTHGTRVTGYKWVTNGTDTFYEVGTDLVAFLISAQLIIEHAGAGAHSGSLRHMPADKNLLILEHPDAVDFSSEAQQWTPPFKLLSGEGIRVQANATATAHACIQGYEIK